MISIAYKCKFCGRDGITQADERGLEMINLQKWIPNICCNRCGKYMDDKRRVMAGIAKVCRELEMGKPDKKPDSAMEALRVLTRKMANIVCDYYHVQFFWEQDFAQQIFEKPSKCYAILAAYMRGVASLRNKQ